MVQDRVIVTMAEEVVMIYRMVSFEMTIYLEWDCRLCLHSLYILQQRHYVFA